MANVWEWCDDEVVASIDRRGLRLPSQYAEIPDSLKCVTCRVIGTLERLRYHNRHWLAASADVRLLIELLLAAVEAALSDGG